MSVVPLHDPGVRDRLLLFGGVPLDAVSSAVLFAGGGGASAGIEAALGRPVDIAVNHCALVLSP